MLDYLGGGGLTIGGPVPEAPPEVPPSDPDTVPTSGDSSGPPDDVL
jgi:hypothetical protein